MLLDILFYSFVVVVAIQTIYYMVFSFFAFLKIQPKKTFTKPVSIIVCAKNEAENIKTFLPSILNQDYPNFEVVLINDASTDDTLDIFKDFASSNNCIRIVDVKNNEAFWGNKKYALTLGIKAAKHEHLLFTDADCKPNSKLWLSQMSSYFEDKKELVLGYGAYAKKKGSFLNKLIRFETLLTAIQYFSYAKIGAPYMGIGRNLAYTKSAFFSTNGFINHMKIRSGDDDLFVNEVATKDNTNICIRKNSFTISEPESSLKNWIRQKRRHISTAYYYKTGHKIVLGLFYMSQISFYLLLTVLLAIQYQWEIVLILIGFRLIFQYLIFGFSANKLREKDLLYVLPILEIALIIIQFSIFISNKISKPTHWK